MRTSTPSTLTLLSVDVHWMPAEEYHLPLQRFTLRWVWRLLPLLVAVVQLGILVANSLVLQSLRDEVVALRVEVQVLKVTGRG